MSAPAPAAAMVNPFSTRFTRPGRLTPLGALGRPLDVAALVAALHAGGGSGAIVGPHGTGKTTLLLTLADRLDAAGSLAGLLRLRSPGDAAVMWRAISRARRGTTLCVDGWECLRPWGRIVSVLAWWRGCRLVVTSHREPGMPILVRAKGTLPILAALVTQVPDHGGLIEDADIADAHRRHGGNLRESLYDLYDRFQGRCR